MEAFPEQLAKQHGDLISIWVLQYMGSQQGATSEEAFAQLLAPSLFDTGEAAFRTIDQALKGKEEADSSTSD